VKEHDLEQIKVFGFKDADEFYDFRQTFDPSSIQVEGSIMYTDGDDGSALITLSDVFDDQGLMIRLIDCNYCDFHMSDLRKIQRKLISERNKIVYSEEDE